MAQSGNNLEHLEDSIRTVLDSPGGGGIKAVELSGGDSAYHPEFAGIVDLLSGRGVDTIYLSSGIVAQHALDRILTEIQNGKLVVSVSPDAVMAVTWARIKKVPACQFERVCRFIERVATANRQQIHVKFIVTEENAHEASKFIAFYQRLGVINFCVSELREEQALHRVKAPTDRAVSIACRDILRSFNEIRMVDNKATLRLSVFGLEPFFENRSSFVRRSPVRQLAKPSALPDLPDHSIDTPGA